MKPLYVYTLFDPKTNKPRCIGIKDGDSLIIKELYKGKGSGNPLAKVLNNIEKIRKLITKSEFKRPIVLSDFKRHIEAFGLEYSTRQLEVYDYHLPDVAPPTEEGRDIRLVTKVLDKMSTQKPRYYQKVLANAQIVYHDLERRGVEINHEPFFPKWSTKTFSGRSKTTGVNLQGWSDHDIVRPPGYNEKDVLIHFDWICADIRVASLLSKDEILRESFVESDPYQKMLDILHSDGDTSVSRDECKLNLLRAINSMDFTSVVLTDIYQDLGRWIRRSKEQAREEGGYLQTILHRKFRTAQAKNELAVLNGVMQGSVAQAMQCVIRRVWERFPSKIVTDIHDSLVVACHSDPSEIRATMSAVADIMLHPFEGVLKSNPAFPVKVSIGKKWKKWTTVKIHREAGVENVAKEQREAETKNPAEGSGEGT